MCTGRAGESVIFTDEGISHNMAARLFWFFVGTILYTYIGYPVLITLIGRRRSATRLPATELPSVTLLIAAYNEEAVIARKLDNSLALDYPADKLQILVTADGSSDRTPEIAATFAGRGVELTYEPPRRGKLAAINRAMQQARGDIVVFSDANNMYAADTLRQMVAPFADPSVGVVTGAKSIVRGDSALGESEGLYWRYESYIKKQENKLGCCTGFSGEILAIRRRLFEEAPVNVINDDFYIAMRIVQKGYRVMYAPDAFSYERVSLTAQEEIQRRARINAGWFQSMAMGQHLLPLHRPLIAWQVISHKYLRPILPWAFLGAWLANVWAVVSPPQRPQRSGCRLSRLAPPFNWIVLAMQVLFYLAACLGQRGGDDTLLGRIVYVPAFLVNSNVAAVIGLYRFLTGQQTPLWQRARRPELDEQ